MLATTGATRSRSNHSSAPVAAPDASNHPVRATTMIGRLSGAKPSVWVVSTYSTRIGSVLQSADDEVDALGERSDVRGIDGRKHADADLVAAELAIAVGVDDAVGAKGGADVVGVDAFEIDRADDLGPFGRIADERRGPLAIIGPAVQRRGRLSAAEVRLRQPAQLEHPLELRLHHHERGDGRRVVRLVGDAVVECDPQVERGRSPSAGGADLADAIEGSRRARCQPESTVAGEALLWCEVVHVDVGRAP